MLEEFHTVTKEERDGASFINFFTLSDELLFQHQVEKRNGLVFMRAKKRILL